MKWKWVLVTHGLKLACVPMAFFSFDSFSAKKRGKRAPSPSSESESEKAKSTCLVLDMGLNDVGSQEEEPQNLRNFKEFSIKIIWNRNYESVQTGSIWIIFQHLAVVKSWHFGSAISPEAKADEPCRGAVYFCFCEWRSPIDWLGLVGSSSMSLYQAPPTLLSATKESSAELLAVAKVHEHAGTVECPWWAAPNLP